MEYYNGKTTSTFTAKITEQLSFEPRVLVTESQELADYFIAPKLVLSKIEPINETNSRYSMSVMVELRKNDGTLVDSETQNRYIIISKEQNAQEIAHKLIEKLLEENKIKLNDLKAIAVSQEIEYLAKEKQISTFLECKKTFFGKFKYYFKYSKKNKRNNIKENAPEKRKEETDIGWLR